MAQGRKILVVDDDLGVVNIIMASLKAPGRTFIAAYDGVDAVEKVMSESPDLVLLDVMMPKMNGYQVCRLLKNDRNTWDIPIIMLTARDKEPDRMYGMSAGADGYIVKPFHPTELRAEVDRLLSAQPHKTRSCPVEPPSRLGEANLLSKVNSLLDRKLQEMTFLQEMTRATVSTFDEERIMGLVLDGIRTYLGYEQAVIFMADEGGLMSEQRSIGYPRAGDKFTFDLTEPELLQDLIHKRRPVVLDGHWDRGSFMSGGASESGGPMHALVPIVARDDVRGILLIDRGGGAPFSQERLGVLSTMASQMGLALENARLYRATLMMSITDGLTGLYNARYFYERLEVELSRAKRYERPLTLFMLDIDLFKRFNDTYGHLVGDEALKWLSGMLRSGIREPDTAARYGGEEFCVILPETDEEHAGVLAERIRHSIAETPMELASDLPVMHITVSIGFASLTDDVNTTEELVKRADRALYKAKQEGRNRVCHFTPALI
jgi:two-component system, cell cycle response regulator